MANIYTPHTESFRGSDATGSNSDTDRTISLGLSTPLSAGMLITIDGVSLVVTADYTLSINVIKFNNALFDTSYIQVTYFTISQTESVSVYACNTLQLNDFMQWTKQIPNYPTTTTLESVDVSGTLATGSKIYLDKGNVIDDTFTISYGASASSVTDLTETTHYTIDLDKSEITLTEAGATAISTGSVFAEYKYNDQIKDSVLSEFIARSSKQIERGTERTFGSVNLVIQEEHTGRGKFSRIYRPLNYLANIVKFTLSSDITATSTELTVSSTDGLVAGDFLSIGTEVLLISSIDDSTTLTVSRGALSSTAAIHIADTWLINVCLERSYTPMGSSPTFDFIEFRKGFDVDSDSGAIQLLHLSTDHIENGIYNDVYPNHTLFSRVKITYKYGQLTVPDTIVRACILLSAYDLTLSGIAKSLPEGRDGFNPTAQKDLRDEYNFILNEYRTLLLDGF